MADLIAANEIPESLKLTRFEISLKKLVLANTAVSLTTGIHQTSRICCPKITRDHSVNKMLFSHSGRC